MLVEERERKKNNRIIQVFKNTVESITRWKVAQVFFNPKVMNTYLNNPKGIITTIYSNGPKGVITALLSISSGLIRIWWYARSKLNSGGWNWFSPFKMGHPGLPLLFIWRHINYSSGCRLFCRITNL